MNKPVAWINTDFDSVSTTPNIRSWLSYTKEGTASQPLYTHPVKEEYESFDRTASHMAGKYVAHPVKELTLTDEEIMQEWTWKYSDSHEDFLLKFARAILRKAQEK